MKIAPFGLSTEEIRRELLPLRSDFSVAVCRAKNPFNVGAIIRVAHSFLVREIFLIGSEPYYERASMGMQKYETIVECPDERAFLQAVEGRPLVGVERDAASTSLWEASMPRASSSSSGARTTASRPRCWKPAPRCWPSPCTGSNHSYPVAIAAGMVMCEWARRRDPRAGSPQTGTTETTGTTGTTGTSR